MKIIGRKTQQAELKQYFTSDKPEFIAVYGRHRVGKTFLIKEFFKDKFAFYFTGSANTNTLNQLQKFSESLNSFGKAKYPIARTWSDAFENLKQMLDKSKVKGKKVIFLDELPWMDTPRSGFVSALDYFWNSWASSRSDILLIVCGSATSWMISKLVKSRGGLHNRITHKMCIEPFSLSECREFFKDNNIMLSDYDIIESYMILGGVPYYLSLMKPGLGLAQNIDALCFARNGDLSNEFENLYSSLFKHSENHIKIVEALGKKSKGLSREEIIKETKISDGGGLTKVLEELDQCGFINKYRDFGKDSKNALFQLVDSYTLFYLTFIKNNKFDANFWMNTLGSPRHRTWSGYAFEQVCMIHIKQLKFKLGISGVSTSVSSWRSPKSATNGAQIDMLIDRQDNIINICEMKYSMGEFSIDKKYESNLRNKRAVFIEESKTRKAVHITMVTTYGVKRNEYSGVIQSEITMEDLFKIV